MFAEDPIDPPAQVSSPLSVRINEVAWMGSDLSTADEWIELTAIPAMTGSVVTESLNLIGWTLSIQKDTGESVIASVTSDLFIGSGQYLVISNSPAASSRLKSEPVLLSSAMSVPNTKLKLFLRDATGQLIDEVDDFVGVPFAGSNPSASTGLPKATMERIDPRLVGTVKESWRTADTKRGFDAASSILGTPGFLNGSVEPPDTTAPTDLLQAIVYSFSGTLLTTWSPCTDADCATIELSANSQMWSMPASSTGTRLPMSSIPSDVLVRTADEQGNRSTGLLIRVQPLQKPIISEFLSDAVGSDDGEWIELQNTHDTPLDLSGWTLRSGSKRWTIPSGTIISSQSVLLLPALLTGLQVANAGGSVTLSLHGMMIDQLSHAGLPEGVSVGRTDPEEKEGRSFCVPTPGLLNVLRSPVIDLVGIEDGQTYASSINVDVRALSGSIAGASCSVDFGDGFISNSCNPPSHAMKKIGNLPITATVHDYCGNTVIHQETITILGSGKSSTTLKQLQTSVIPSCTPASIDGLVVSEIYPAPVPGEEEWVELHNTTDMPMDLCGWALDDVDGGSKPYKLDGRSIAPGGYFALTSKDTGIAWNNDVDTIRMIGPLPDGGTGAVLAFPYTDSIKQQSFARRSDDVYIWTPYPSVGMANQFVVPDTEPGFSPVILSAALPNPSGADTFDEWIELENITGRPQWLNGWYLQSNDGKKIVFDKRVLAKRELQKVLLYKTGITLRNSDGALRLYDDDHILRSVLAWDTTKDGHVHRPDRTCEETPIAQIRVMGPLSFRARTSSEPGTPYFDFTLSGVLLPSPSIDMSFTDYKFLIENYVSTLLNNKKLVYKKCSIEGHSTLTIDNADLRLLLLTQGYVMVDTALDSEYERELLAYEQESREQRQGLWSDVDQLVLVNAWRRNAEMDALVVRDGLQVDITEEPGLVMPGTIVSVSANAPVRWEVKRGTGAYIPFAGSVSITGHELVTFRALYEFLTTSGSEVRTSVVTQEYDVLRESYPECIRLSEVYPSPAKGEKEWIELQNVCDEPVSLLGWQIDDVSDGGSRPFTIKSSRVVPPGGLVVLSGSHLPIALNNGGDSVLVYSPDKRVQDAMSYLKTGSKQAIALSQDSYCTTIVASPGAFNTCVKPIPKHPKAQKSTVKPLQIGIKTLYSSLLQDSSLLMYKNSDQHNRFMEGLNMNITIKNSEHGWSVVLALLLCLGFSSVSGAIWLKVRSYGSLS